MLSCIVSIKFAYSIVEEKILCVFFQGLCGCPTGYAVSARTCVVAAPGPVPAPFPAPVLPAAFPAPAFAAAPFFPAPAPLPAPAFPVAAAPFPFAGFPSFPALGPLAAPAPFPLVAPAVAPVPAIAPAPFSAFPAAPVPAFPAVAAAPVGCGVGLVLRAGVCAPIAIPVVQVSYFFKFLTVLLH